MKLFFIFIFALANQGFIGNDKTITLVCVHVSESDIDYDYKFEVDFSKKENELIVKPIYKTDTKFFEDYPTKFNRLNKEYFLSKEIIPSSIEKFRKKSIETQKKTHADDYKRYQGIEKSENVMVFLAPHLLFDFDMYILVQNNLTQIEIMQFGIFECENKFNDKKKSIFDSLFSKEYENLTEMKKELERIGNITIDFKDYTYEGCGMFGCLESAEFYDYDDFSETFVFRFSKNQKIAEHAVQFFERMCRPRIDVGNTVFCVRFPGEGDKGPKTIKLIESLN